ncbi:MAG: PBSX family phage terminase large subunit [Oscillospiraceae bacterium]|nr:PBSX family phage terminase large subunit [Oscillospiraceae bacterium]
MTEERAENQYRLAQWYQNLRESSNPAFLPLFGDTHRYLVLKGGGGSGKSIFAGRKVLERVTAEEGHRWLVCRKVARTLRESCFQQLLGQLERHYQGVQYRASKTEPAIRFSNGSEILFAGLDDVEKLKSIYNITGIWIEEASELLEGDFNQLDIRLRGETKYYKQIILTFNPVSSQHWLKRRLFNRRGPLAAVHESTYKDNRFLDREAVRTLEGFRDTDEYYYMVYALGMWGVTGRSVFNAREVARRLEDNIQPVRRGYFTYEDDGRTLQNIRWEDDPEGFIKLYAEAAPGVPYVLGGDTAGEGSDSFAAQVLDNRTGVQVAALRHQFDEDLFARQVYCLGLYYNRALVGLENNFSTYPTMELQRLGYPKQYVRESVDDYTHRFKSSFGVWTGSKTRPAMLAQLIRAVREDVDIVCDRDTLQEMLTFVRGEDWKPQAERGAHDDCVMALAIAHYIRPQQSYLVQANQRPARWSPSQWEDYENASPEERERLIEKWGRPGNDGN